MTKPDSYVHLISGLGSARVVFTDPPYNFKIYASAGDPGAIKDRKIVAASGEMVDEEFVTFLAALLAASADAQIDGDILFVRLGHSAKLCLPIRLVRLYRPCAEEISDHWRKRDRDEHPDA